MCFQNPNSSSKGIHHVAQPHMGEAAPSVFVLLHLLWGVGLGLYGIFIALFAYRIFFFDVEPDDVTPLLWVVMGAAAISTNAGSTLILTESGIPFLLSMRPFIDGVTLLPAVPTTPSSAKSPSPRPTVVLPVSPLLRVADLSGRGLLPAAGMGVLTRPSEEPARRRQ